MIDEQLILLQVRFFPHRYTHVSHDLKFAAGRNSIKFENYLFYKNEVVNLE